MLIKRFGEHKILLILIKTIVLKAQTCCELRGIDSLLETNNREDHFASYAQLCEKHSLINI